MKRKCSLHSERFGDYAIAKEARLAAYTHLRYNTIAMADAIPVEIMNDTLDSNDYLFIERAFELAEHADPHRTYPNPLVGAVITRDGEVIATGYHTQAGAAHAEAVALESAGVHAANATLYTTLEPCSYRGADKRTPPCVEKIIAAGISRVVIGATDPHARENGRGIEVLQQNNVRVTIAKMQERFTRQNEEYVVRMRHGRPLLEIKLAQTIDGYSADSFNNSQWISDHGALRFAHHLRARHHAILIGANTARHDNPILSARFGLNRYPTRIVLDRNLSLPSSLKLFQTAKQTATYLVHDHANQNNEKIAQLDNCGVHRIVLDSSSNNFHTQLFTYLCHHNICGSVLVEGGSRIISDLIEAEMWDRLSLVISPTLLMNGRHLQSRRPRNMTEIIALDKAKWQPLTNFESQCMVLRGYRSCTHSFGISAESYGGSWGV